MKAKKEKKAMIAVKGTAIKACGDETAEGGIGT